MALETADVGKLSRELRLLPEPTAYTRLIELSEENQFLAAQLAPRVLKARAFQRDLLRHILLHVNAHSIKWWLAAFVPRLGIVEVLRILSEEVHRAPGGIERAMYFLPGFIDGDEQAQRLLSELTAALSGSQSEPQHRQHAGHECAAATRRPKPQAEDTRAIEPLERELEALRQRQAELRAQIRGMRDHEGVVRKLEQKLANQLASAKWTAAQIKHVQPNWDELGFYDKVPAEAPSSRPERAKQRKDLQG
jgi:hypothetical protein